MNEERNSAGSMENTRTLPVRSGSGRQAGPLGSDLVVDLTGMGELSVTHLALLLTAQQNAAREHKSVWLAGVGVHVWQALHGMGLGRYFKPFPSSLFHHPPISTISA